MTGDLDYGTLETLTLSRTFENAQPELESGKNDLTLPPGPRVSNWKMG